MPPGALLAMLIATASPAAGPGPAISPDWLSRPSAEDVGRLYPIKARERVLSGRAVISCTIADGGRLSGCTVASEAPAGFGFGDAALKAAVQFVARSQGDEDGRAFIGQRVELPIAFTIKGWVDLRCGADAADKATGCRALSEHPPDRGFGALYATSTNGVAYSPQVFRRLGDVLETTVSFAVPVDPAATP